MREQWNQHYIKLYIVNYVPWEYKMYREHSVYTVTKQLEEYKNTDIYTVKT